jgi:peptidylprolyl isomerase/peptidyl-prolyl cis-trans isomerase B (cyclophilin B)
MKKIARFFPFLIAALIVVSGCSRMPFFHKEEGRFVEDEAGNVRFITGEDEPRAASPEQQEQEKKARSENMEEVAVLKTNKGVIVFKFFPEDAPNTVENFKTLVQDGFYDGLTFHRVVPDFVIQGGDPEGTGEGGPGYTIKDEFNARPHLEGTVAMARSPAPNSAGSQFYICLDALPQLDGKYTVFGQVIEGLEVVHKIKVGDKMDSISIEEQEVPF